MIHTVTLVQPDQLDLVLKDSIAVRYQFLHPYVQQVIVDECKDREFVGISMPNLATLNVIINGRQPKVISFMLY